MKGLGSWVACILLGLTFVASSDASGAPPLLTSLPPGTKLRIDAPPSRFEAEFLRVDYSADALVVAGEWWQERPDGTRPERRLGLSAIRGIEYRYGQQGLHAAQGALRGLGVGLLAGLAIGGALAAHADGDGIISPGVGLAIYSGAGGMLGALVGFTTTLATQGHDWRPVDLRRPAGAGLDNPEPLDASPPARSPS